MFNMGLTRLSKFKNHNAALQRWRLEGGCQRRQRFKMVQASDKQSREANEETRRDIENDYKGRFYCHERKDYFAWKEFINYNYKT